MAIYIKSKKMLSYIHYILAATLQNLANIFWKKNANDFLKGFSCLISVQAKAVHAPTTPVSPKAQLFMDSRILQSYRVNKVAITTILDSITVCLMGHSGPWAAIKV